VLTCLAMNLSLLRRLSRAKAPQQAGRCVRQLKFIAKQEC